MNIAGYSEQVTQITSLTAEQKAEKLFDLYETEKPLAELLKMDIKNHKSTDHAILKRLNDLHKEEELYLPSTNKEAIRIGQIMAEMETT